MFDALIVDDELLARNCLHSLLMQHCPLIKSFFFAENITIASNIFNDNNIDILFLDINMGEQNGFDLLQQIPYKDQAVIFVTAYEEFSLKALKSQAVDYLLKPIDIDELVLAVEKAINFLGKTRSTYAEIATGSSSQQIVVNHYQGFELLHLSKILFAEAKGSYTIFYMEDRRTIIASKQLGFYEDVLIRPDFFRSHKSYIINLQYLKGFSSRNGYFALLSDDFEVPVSRRKLPEFLDLCKK